MTSVDWERPGERDPAIEVLRCAKCVNMEDIILLLAERVDNVHGKVLLALSFSKFLFYNRNLRFYFLGRWSGKIVRRPLCFAI